MKGIVSNLPNHFPEASFLVFNFHGGEKKSYIAELLSEYNMKIMDYTCHSEGCPLIAMEVLHHFMRSCESWLSFDQNNLLLMHCERGGWPLLAFVLAALLLYRKQYSGEQKTLDMIYRQAPNERLQMLSSLNPMPSQLRYLQYISRRNVAADGPSLDQSLTLDCVILRHIPNIDGEGGCRPIFRIYGQDPSVAADKTPKLLYSSPKRSKHVRYYKQKECALVKIDINCHVQDDVVVECVNLNGKERQKIIFRVVFNAAFIRSNILMLNRDEIDILWDAKEQFPKEFTAEILFSEMDAASSVTPADPFRYEEKEGLPVEAFSKVQEMFNDVDWMDSKSDATYNMLQQIGALNIAQEKSDSDSNNSVDSPRQGRTSPRTLWEEKLLAALPGSPRSPTTMCLKTLVVPSVKSPVSKEAKPQDSRIEPFNQSDVSHQQNNQSAALAKNHPTKASSSVSSPASAVASPGASPLTPFGKEDCAARETPPDKSPPPKTPPVKEDPVVRVTSLATPPVKENQIISGTPPETSPSLKEILAGLMKTPAPIPLSASPLSKLESARVRPLEVPAPPTTMPPFKENAASMPAPPPSLPPLYCIQEASPTTSSSAPPPPPPPSPTAGASSVPPTTLAPPSPPTGSSPPPSPPPQPPTVSAATTPPQPPTVSSAATPPPPPTVSSSAPPPPPPTGSSTAPPPPPPTGSLTTPPPPPTAGSSSAPLPPPHPPTTGSSTAPPQPPTAGSSSAPLPLPHPPTTGSSIAPPPPPTVGSSTAPPPPPPPPPPTTGSSTAPPPPPAPFGKKAGSGPSAPAPPPFISSANAKNRLLSRGHSKNDQNKKLKPLHWLKLSRAVQGSLWAEAQKTGEVSKAPEIDISELENLFSAAAPNTGRSKSSSRAAKGPKTEKVQLSSVLALEESALDADQVDNLIKFCPTKEEMELLKGYTGDRDKLGKCEQFFLELMEVPRVESKLRVFSFKIQFRSQIRNSVKLKRVMQTILSLGNALNQGTARGSAIGFRLDSLLKLTDTRARNNKMTLMHYLCKVLADKLPVVLDFTKDVSSLEPASKIQLKFLAEEMQAISKGLEKVVQELSSSENDGPVSDNFRKELKEFLCFAEAEVRSLASLYAGVGRHVDALIVYFGEDPAKCSFEQVTSTLLNFVRMFNKAHDENCKQLEQEMKKLAENEKSKASPLQNESKNTLQTS
ncbi:hypothetical protein V6N13_136344 [Hibiscus sabdariffa]